MQKDKFDLYQKRIAGSAVVAFVLYFYILDKLKEGLAEWYSIVQQSLALLIVVLALASGWKFVEVLLQAKSEASQKLIDSLKKKKEEIEEENK